jgi:hypothetical protein
MLLTPPCTCVRFCRGCGIWPVSSSSSTGAAAAAAGGGGSGDVLSAAVAAAAAAAVAADVALDPTWEPLSQEVLLPSLDTLVLHVHGE